MTEQEIYALAERVARDYGANDLTQDAFVARAAIRLVLAQLAAAPVAQEDTRLRDMEIERDTLRHGLRLANERIADLTAPAQGQPFVFDKRQALTDAANKVRDEQAAQGERQPDGPHSVTRDM